MENEMATEGRWQGYMRCHERLQGFHRPSMVDRGVFGDFDPKPNHEHEPPTLSSNPKP